MYTKSNAKLYYVWLTFKLFLRRHKMHDKYMLYMKSRRMCVGGVKDFDNPIHWIDGSHSWSTSPEGYAYWEVLHYQWLELYRKHWYYQEVPNYKK